MFLSSVETKFHKHRSHQAPAATTTGTTPAPPKEQPYRGYFYIQRFYPGVDPIDNIKESEFHARQMFFELNKEMLFFAKSLERIEDVEDSISIAELYDNKVDDAANGKCCSRISFHTFPTGKGIEAVLAATVKTNEKTGKSTIQQNKNCDANCSKDPVSAPSKPKAEIKKEKSSPKAEANNCLDLFVPDEARWRICSPSQDKITELHTKLLFNILEGKFKNNPSLISNVLAKARIGREPPQKDWTWGGQEHWGGFCKSEVMQSPINILTSKITKPETTFSIKHQLLQVHTMMKRNGKEVITTFLNYGGAFQINIHNSYILFTPTYMSYRFPGEHLIDGERSMGEILLHFAEVSNQRKNTTSKGLILTIPIKPAKDALNVKTLEHLNFDFWKYEIQKHGTYTPKKFLGKKLLTFDLKEFMGKVESLNPSFTMYLGSQTTPPCEEQTYHIVVNKALSMAGCEFKLLRDNSLFSSKAKEIHSRVEKPLQDRPLYSFNLELFKYLPTLTNVMPQRYNKKLLQNPIGKYKGKRIRYDKNGRPYILGPDGKPIYIDEDLGAQGALDLYIDKLNCDLPKKSESGVQ